jgi:hypothetical protein
MSAPTRCAALSASRPRVEKEGPRAHRGCDPTGDLPRDPTPERLEPSSRSWVVDRADSAIRRDCGSPVCDATSGRTRSPASGPGQVKRIPADRSEKNQKPSWVVALSGQARGCRRSPRGWRGAGSGLVGDGPVAGTCVRARYEASPKAVSGRCSTPPMPRAALAHLPRAGQAHRQLQPADIGHPRIGRDDRQEDP